ncbi:hypothetical protein HRR83_006484 [Exophiala dermatitidis]|nr:hypothetical protein HRR73_008759 [Exophiala dermatitidis]KAJ4505330.1 hypothetical protein HRR74_008701 [Exophiala dermatitidis]KAJ4530685.1 hypothetical protein HRR76_008382 [Exophiala dermatitidis]KAJ4563237.1 hypothetical protein HRR81_008564 [Exophiala dermatitidis]KAJ4567281.1 hypothetical protein HRR82_008358 [Exophiala dermatitidis]
MSKSNIVRLLLPAGCLEVLQRCKPWNAACPVSVDNNMSPAMLGHCRLQIGCAPGRGQVARQAALVAVCPKQDFGRGQDNVGWQSVGLDRGKPRTVQVQLARNHARVGPRVYAPLLTPRA